MSDLKDFFEPVKTITAIDIVGSDTYTNIIAIDGNEGEAYVSTTADGTAGVQIGDTFVSNGKGTGAANWINVGPMRGPAGPPGPAGPEGPKGDSGQSFRFMGQADYDTILAKTGAQGDIWIVSQDHPPQAAQGDAYISDGQGIGPMHWNSLGLMRPPGYSVPDPDPTDMGKAFAIDSNGVPRWGAKIDHADQIIDGGNF